MATKNGKRTKTKKRITTATNFPRVRRLPERVQSASELWLDMFMRNIDALIGDDRFNEVEVINIAESLANRALDCFQTRWPNAEIPASE